MLVQARVDSYAQVKKKFEAEMEQMVLSVAKALYKTKPQVKKYPAKNSGVWGLQFDDNRVDRVIKLGVKPSKSLVREQQIMIELRKYGLAVPEIEYTQLDLPGTWIPFMIMPKVTHTNLTGACINDRPHAMEACRKAGEFLAQLNQIPIDSFPLSPSIHLMAENLKDGLSSEAIDLKRWNKVVANLNQWQAITPKIQHALDKVKHIFESRDYPNIAHRDFIPRQILADPKTFAVIDWESAAPGKTLRDLGHFIGGIRRVIEHENQYSLALMEGFCSIQPLSEEEMAEVKVWEIYSTLRAAVEQGHRNYHEQARKLLEFVEQPSLIEPFRLA
jgi:aminoglycoside phosphotransferase (APT) family kinase protein